MSDTYNKTVWAAGDVVTAAKMNNAEDQIEALSNEIKGARSYGEGESGSLGQRIDDMIMYQANQPSSAANELWVKSDAVTQVQVPTYDEFEDLRDDVGNAYSTTKSYAVGDYVMKDNKLYKCTAETSGAWNADSWTEAVVGDEISDLNGYLDQNMSSILQHFEELKLRREIAEKWEAKYGYKNYILETDEFLLPGTYTNNGLTFEWDGEKIHITGTNTSTAELVLYKSTQMPAWQSAISEATYSMRLERSVEPTDSGVTIGMNISNYTESTAFTNTNASFINWRPTISDGLTIKLKIGASQNIDITVTYAIVYRQSTSNLIWVTSAMSDANDFPIDSYIFISTGSTLPQVANTPNSSSPFYIYTFAPNGSGIVKYQLAYLYHKQKQAIYYRDCLSSRNHEWTPWHIIYSNEQSTLNENWQFNARNLLVVRDIKVPLANGHFEYIGNFTYKLTDIIDNAATLYNLTEGTTDLAGLVPGETYNLKYNGYYDGVAKIAFEIFYTTAAAPTSWKVLLIKNYDDATFTVPEAAIGILYRFNIPADAQITEMLLQPIVMNTKTNQELAADITDLTTSISTVQDDIAEINTNIDNISQTFGINLFTKDNSYAKLADLTQNGIQYTWDSETTTYTAVGTTSASQSWRNLIESTKVLPTFLATSRRYYIVFEPTVPELNLQWYVYLNGSTSATLLAALTSSSIIRIPENTTGVIMRLRVPPNTTVDGSAELPQIYDITDGFIGSIFNQTAPTQTINQNTFTNTYNITTTPNITTDSNGWLQAVDTNTESETGKTDMTGAIMSMLNSTGYCHLGPGIFYVSGGINMPEYSTLEGCGEATIIRLLSSVENGYCVRIHQKNTVQNIVFSGAYNLNTALVATPDIGGRNGIYFVANSDGKEASSTSVLGNMIRNCWFKGFSGSAIYAHNTGGGTRGSIFSDCYFEWCKVGINFDYYTEYHKVSNCITYRCYYACINNGGNNVFTGCTFHGTIGFLMDNSDSTKRNNAHGSVVGCTFNHIDNWNNPDVLGMGTAIKCIKVRNAYIFTGCQLWYGGIDIQDSIGIGISNCLLGGNSPSIAVTGDSTVFFSDCVFHQYPSIIATTGTHFDHCYLDSTGAPVQKSGPLLSQLLTDLNIEGQQLEPSFNPLTFEYTLNYIKNTSEEQDNSKISVSTGSDVKTTNYSFEDEQGNTIVNASDYYVAILYLAGSYLSWSQTKTGDFLWFVISVKDENNEIRKYRIKLIKNV